MDTTPPPSGDGPATALRKAAHLVNNALTALGVTLIIGGAVCWLGGCLSIDRPDGRGVAYIGFGVAAVILGSAMRVIGFWIKALSLWLIERDKQ